MSYPVELVGGRMDGLTLELPELRRDIRVAMPANTPRDLVAEDTPLRMDLGFARYVRVIGPHAKDPSIVLYVLEDMVR